jgi:hypothetical protein
LRSLCKVQTVRWNPNYNLSVTIETRFCNIVLIYYGGRKTKLDFIGKGAVSRNIRTTRVNLS